MYVPDSGLEGLGALPKWMRDLGARLIAATTVSIPTPTGPIIINLGDKAAVDQLKRSVTGARVQVGSQAPSVLDQAREAINRDLPGGGWTLGLGAAAAVGVIVWLASRRS